VRRKRQNRQKRVALLNVFAEKAIGSPFLPNHAFLPALKCISKHLIYNIYKRYQALKPLQNQAFQRIFRIDAPHF